MSVSKTQWLSCALAAVSASATLFTTSTVQAIDDPPVYNTIQSGVNASFDRAAVMKTSDLFSPHNECNTFELLHVGNRLGPKVLISEPDKLIVGDPERLRYNNNQVVNHENPEDALNCVAAMRFWRPNNPIGIDGGLPLSWSRLLAKDSNGQYRHHDEWRAEALPWSLAIEPADFWVSSHYRDGRSQDDWLERLDVFVELFRETFGDEKPLGIYIWHRERVGEERNQIWITQADYVEMGLAALDRGCMVFAFGREDDPADFLRAQQYFNALWIEALRR